LVTVGIRSTNLVPLHRLMANGMVTHDRFFDDNERVIIAPALQLEIGRSS
jgi:hypothetical protein